MIKIRKIYRNRLFKRAILFSVGISIVFFAIRFYFGATLSSITRNVPSLTSMYAVLGAIYSLITAFVIHNQWNNWNSLISGCNEETNGFRQLNLFLKHFPAKYSKNIREKVMVYLKSLIDEYWKNREVKVRTERIEESLNDLVQAMYNASEEIPKFNMVMINIIHDINKGREKRLHYSSRHLPFLIKTFIGYMTITMIGLSFAIGLSNIWIDYVFTLSLAMNFFLIFLIIDDMEHPYRPGTWHVSMREYRVLLDEMEK